MRRPRPLLRDETGATMVETAIVFPMVLMLLFGLAEFAHAFWEYHTAEKATVIGARFLATRGPLVPQLADGGHDCFVANPTTVAAGTPCSDAAVPAAAGPITCTSSASAACSAAVRTAMLTQMQQIAPFITNADVQVDVAQSKMGFIGRGKAVPVITVRTTGLTYSFVAIGRLLGLAGPITMPSFASTLTAEDQQEGPGT
jgi:hypothetical protein